MIKQAGNKRKCTGTVIVRKHAVKNIVQHEESGCSDKRTVESYIKRVIRKRKRIYTVENSHKKVIVVKAVPDKKGQKASIRHQSAGVYHINKKIVRVIKRDLFDIGNSPLSENIKTAISTNKPARAKITRKVYVKKTLAETAFPVSSLRQVSKKTVVVKNIRTDGKTSVEKKTPETILAHAQKSVTNRKQSDQWSECGQVFFTGGKAFGIASNLKTICVGDKNAVQGFFENVSLEGRASSRTERNTLSAFAKTVAKT
jgi:hypothetical protein